MRSIGKQFGFAFIGALPVAFLLQLYLERTGNSDVLGLWYTIYCATLYSMVVAALVSGGIALTRRLWRSRQ